MKLKGKVIYTIYIRIRTFEGTALVSMVIKQLLFYYIFIVIVTNHKAYQLHRKSGTTLHQPVTFIFLYHHWYVLNGLSYQISLHNTTLFIVSYYVLWKEQYLFICKKKKYYNFFF